MPKTYEEFRVDARTRHRSPIKTTRLFRRTFFCISVLLYVFTKYVLISFLPQKWFGDSSRLIDMANNVVEGAGSYAATAALYALFPLWMLDAIVTLVGVILLYHACRSVKTARAFIIMSSLLLLSVPQTLLVPNKETIVISMTLIIFTFSRKYRGVALSAIIIALYITYGYFVRSYFLLILLVWLSTQIFTKANILFKTSLIFLFVAIALLVPVDILQKMQGQRDAANSWALYILHADNRTAFFNIVPPTDLANFFVNYVYAASILNFPLIKWWSIKEIIFSGALIGCFVVLYRSMKDKNPAVRSLGLLFFSHLVVLCTFEPDLGSYFRHFSSVLAYLFPAFGLLGMERAEEDRFLIPEVSRKIQ